jgi:hypothetical protein
MTSGAGRAWRSTVGGRSVSRTAAAIQGASLRTLPLVRPAMLASLTNPLEPLLAGAPSLDVLGETAARVTGGAQRSRAGTPPAQRPGQSPATGSATSSAPATGSPQALSGRSAPAVPSPNGTQNRRPVGLNGTVTAPSPAGGKNGNSALSAADLTNGAGQSGPITLGTTGQSSARTSGEHAGNDSPSAPALAAVLDRVTNRALAAAARLDSGRSASAPAPAANPVATPSGVPDVDGDATRGRPPQQPLGPAASASSAPAPFAEAPVGGALGELLGRWQQSASLPDLSPMAASHSPFAPLSTAATTGFAQTGGSPDSGGGDEVSLDQVQLALDELLRREVEQHGLEGGLV